MEKITIALTVDGDAAADNSKNGTTMLVVKMFNRFAKLYNNALLKSKAEKTISSELSKLRGEKCKVHITDLGNDLTNNQIYLTGVIG